MSKIDEQLLKEMEEYFKLKSSKPRYRVPRAELKCYICKVGERISYRSYCKKCYNSKVQTTEKQRIYQQRYLLKKKTT